MASPISKAGFPDLLDPRFREITYNSFKLQRDMAAFFYEMINSNVEVERGSDLINMGDAVEFTGTVTYDGPEQGYDWTATHKEFALGVQVERRLFEFDQFNAIDRLFQGLGDAFYRKRQKDAARLFNNAFADDTYFYDTTENVALCSNSHTTTKSGVSTTSGFDNLTTGALSPAELGTVITAFRKYKDLSGERINAMPDTLLVPVDLRDRALEIVKTEKGLDSAEGTVNVYKSDYEFKVVDWIYLTDANDWFLLDSKLMKQTLKWFQAVPEEFARVEDFDTIIAKYRGYSIYTIGRSPQWQFVNGAQVS